MFSLELTQNRTIFGLLIHVNLASSHTNYLVSKKPLHDSSVVSVSFDPKSSRVVATASTDGFCKLVTCYKPELD
jgi:WD40 repeat protein